jgi:hypothetical protein
MSSLRVPQGPLTLCKVEKLARVGRVVYSPCGVTRQQRPKSQWCLEGPFASMVPVRGDVTSGGAAQAKISINSIPAEG